MTQGSTFRESWSLILAEIHRALEAVEEAQVEALVDALLAAEKVFLTGVGRVALSLQAMVKRLNHLEVPAWFVGDLSEPAITEKDLLLVGSGSGESVVPVAIAGVAKKHGARIAHIGSNPESSLRPLADVFVRLPVPTRLRRSDEIPSQQIMTSLFEQALYVLADAVSLIILERKGITDLSALWQHHANLE
jgi:6-phospho-3-hexuloisomerase